MGNRHGARAAPPRRRDHRREVGRHAGERGSGQATRSYLGATPTNSISPSSTGDQPEIGYRVRAGAVRLRSTSKVRALPAHAGAPPAHQLSQAQRQWSVLPRAAEACEPCLRRRLTGAAHSAPRPRTCDHHLEQARWPQPTCTSHASALCTRISSPVLLLMTVRHRCVCRGPRTTCTSGRAARCSSASAWSLSMTSFLNDCALRCARAARGLRLLQT